jgi:hypothetical protein
MRRTAFFWLAGLLVAGVALGEDFWVKKEYTQWTEEEVRKVMTNSPWAKDVTVSAPPGTVGGGVRGPQNSGIDVEGSGGGGRGRGGRGGRGGDADGGGGGGGEALLTLNMSWRSALPLRKAIVKSRIGGSTEVPAEAQQLLVKEQEEYVIVVSGVPARVARQIQDPARLNRSTLKAGKRAPVTPKAVDFQTRTQTVDVFFIFPKTEAITLEDKEVELDLKLGAMEAKRKFNLKDMVYNGKLEL